jgi:hypothetical protein
MSTFVEWYRSFLRPGRKTSDMFIPACLSTFVLLMVGSLVSAFILRLLGLPTALDENAITQIANGETTTEEAVGAPAYLVWASAR